MHLNNNKHYPVKSLWSILHWVS